MRFLRYGSAGLLLLLIAGCAKNHYAFLSDKPRATRPSVLPQNPQQQRVLYRCIIDGGFLFKKFHLSGLLLFKSLPDNSTRVVFANESGLTFFDFGWTTGDSFHVARIIPKLDKAPVVATLRKDIELLLCKDLDPRQESILNNYQTFDSSITSRKFREYWHKFPLAKGYVYYAEEGGRVRLIETVSKAIPVTSIYLFPPMPGGVLPDSFSVVHRRAHFTINAKSLRDAAE